MIKLYMGKIAFATIIAFNTAGGSFDLTKQAEVYNPFMVAEKDKKEAFATKTIAPCFVWTPDFQSVDNKPINKKIK